MQSNSNVISINIQDNIETGLSKALYLTAFHVGFHAMPYRNVFGKAAVGFGTTTYPDGVEVSLSDNEITESLAGEILEWDLRYRFLPTLLQASPNLKKYPMRLGAVLSFCYSAGRNAYARSIVRKFIQEENWDGAAMEIRGWVYISGERHEPFVKHREEEAQLILGQI